MLQIDGAANISILQKALRPIATLELFNSDWNKRLWRFAETEKIDYWLEQSGYSSKLFQFTLGLTIYAFAIALVLVPFSFIVGACMTKKKYVFNKHEPTEYEGGDSDDEIDYIE